MAPWSRNRAGKANERVSKQKGKAQAQNTVTESPGQFQDSAVAAAAHSASSSPRRTRRVRDSVVSLSAVQDPPLALTQSPSLLEVPEDIGRTTNRRFSLLKFRHASDSHLSRTAKEHAESSNQTQFVPPSIIATAPTFDNIASPKRKSALLFVRRNKDNNLKDLFSPDIDGENDAAQSRRTFDNGVGTSARVSAAPPPPYGDDSLSSLALPVNRASESDTSSADHGVFATTTTTHTVSTTTTFFKLPRRKKDKGPLFPLPPKAISANASLGGTPRLSAAESGTSSPGQYFEPQPEQSTDGGSPRRPRIPGFSSKNRSQSRASQRSARASSQLARVSGGDLRGRSSTMTSGMRRGFIDEEWVIPTPPLPQSTRTSTSTAGRPSIAGLFNLARIRQLSEPLGRNSNGGPDTPGSIDLHPETPQPPIVIPERQEGDTAAKYLARLEEVVHRSTLVAIISKTNEDFMKSVLRSFMRRFSFFEDPLDMAVRKLLMHIDLPKETQQIDRTLQAFADRYHECNPGVFPTSDHAYFCAFSIVILHTDAFNKNNKHKMQKTDYIKNAREQSGVSPEVMDCFYDNIVYTPFIHLEDDVTIPQQQAVGQKASKKVLKAPTTPLKKLSSGPIDPYALILDGKLDTLRPELNEILSVDDPFNCTGTLSSINVAELNRVFLKYGILQVLSSRSRPGAFMSPATISNPAEAQVGVVDMKVTKIGVLWRKDPKKKKTRSPWQEWGAILTPSQIYLFRNTSWIKTLIHQYESHAKTKTASAVVFTPPLEQFSPDFSLSMDDAVAVVDAEYKKHKHSFFITRSTSFQEVFLADNEWELNDWIARINFAAAYRTSGVRMRAFIGGESQTQGPLDGESKSPDTAANDATLKPPPTQLRHDATLTRQVMEARTQIMQSKIKHAITRKEDIEKNLQQMLRLSRQMCVLTPIQDKTKQAVVDGTIRLAANIRWTRIEYWRVRCHNDILQADLELDNPVDETATNVSKNDLALQQTKDEKKEERSRLGFPRLTSRSGGNSAASKTRPSHQPNGRQLFSMDDIFRSPSRTRQSHHKAKASWELPPLSFERGRSVSSSRPSRRSSEAAVDRVSTARSESIQGSTESMKSDAPNSEHIDDDYQALVDAGILPAETKSSEENALVESDDEEKAKVPELDEKETSKVRHSFQNKLQKAHIPTPSRSKKHRDSVNSTAVSDDSVSVEGAEGLIRGPGKFSVHGKKASVVTIGSDWHDMTAEERIRARSSTHGDDLHGTTISEIPTPIQEGYQRSSSSSSSGSTARHGSTEFVTPTEKGFQQDDMTIAVNGHTQYDGDKDNLEESDILVNNTSEEVSASSQ